MAHKKRIFSAVQPSGVPTLGNYFGAFKNFAAMQDEYECFYSVANMHAITVRQDPSALKQRTEYVYALLLACGVDPAKSVFFVQSHVSQHAELAWILNCYTMFGELSRMTQFKDKSKKRPENINVGLFSYPALMAADILLYDAEFVPVGEDQKQHVELSRDIALRLNSIYPSIVVVPEPVIPKIGGRIMSLVDPTKKMDKSDPNLNAFISLSDDKDTIIKKFKKAVTDSEPIIRYDKQNKAGVSNLLSIYSLCTNKTIEECEKEFDGAGYGTFKVAVGEAVNAVVEPIRAKTDALLSSDRAHLNKLINDGAQRAAAEAEHTMRRIREGIGFLGKGV